MPEGTTTIKSSNYLLRPQGSSEAGRNDHNRGLHQSSLSAGPVGGHKGRPQSWLTSIFSVRRARRKPQGTTTIVPVNNLLRPQGLSEAARDDHNQVFQLSSPSAGPVGGRKGRPQSSLPLIFSVPTRHSAPSPVMYCCLRFGKKKGDGGKCLICYPQVGH